MKKLHERGVRDTNVLLSQWRQECEPALLAAKLVQDPNERLALAIHYWTVPDANGTPKPDLNEDFFQRTFPDIWPESHRVDFELDPPPWDSDLVAQWVAKRAIEAEWDLNKSEYVFSRKEKTLPRREWGYVLAEAGRHYRNSDPESSAEFGNRGYVKITQSGQFIISPERGYSDCFISAYGLKKITEKLGLSNPSVALPPRPIFNKYGVGLIVP